MTVLAADPVNARHLAIFHRVAPFVQSDFDVYEVGCGTGPVTEALAPYLRDGLTYAVDVDADRVAVAQVRLERWHHVTCRVADAVEHDPGRSFDLILLPDVLEHVTPERHPVLFKRLAWNLRSDGRIFINTPNPLYLQWITETQPEVLQEPCDRPVETLPLLAALDAADLVLERLETYPVWDPNGDYQAIWVRHRATAAEFTTA